MAPRLTVITGGASDDATVRDLVHAHLRDDGLQATVTAAGSLSVSESGVTVEVRVAALATDGSAAAVPVALPRSHSDTPLIHVVVFTDPASGQPRGSVLVVSEETLADTLDDSGEQWRAKVTPVAEDNPRLPLDVCVAPLEEVAAWVRAEIAAAAEESEEERGEAGDAEEHGDADPDD